MLVFMLLAVKREGEGINGVEGGLTGRVRLDPNL